MKIRLFILSAVTLATIPGRTEFDVDWDKSADRVWLGAELWANPMEDFRLVKGRVETIRPGANRNVHVLTHQLADKDGGFTTRVRFGRLNDGQGSAGFRVGINADWGDYRTWCLHGSGLNAGLLTDGSPVIGNKRSESNPGLANRLGELELELEARPNGDHYLLALSVTGTDTQLEAKADADQLVGNIALVSNFYGVKARRGLKSNWPSMALFWFDDWKVSGSKVVARPEQAWGPILWTMHSLSRKVMKLSAQFPPLGENVVKVSRLEVKRGLGWTQIAQARINPKSYTALFRVEDWDDTKDTSYRVAYSFEGREHYWYGSIRHDPVEREELMVAGFTGNTDGGFPNREVALNVARHDPDLLFFSGDQIYEGVGGYGIHRKPVDVAILNYLRKWYLFGWAFGDLMRDRVTLCLPDDHDVYQGNIWGENGRSQPSMAAHARGGYVMHADFVNAMQRTQFGHHPDPFDSTPIEQSITVGYGDMVYGRVSFAIIEDRKFKSGPHGRVNTWPGRPDHVKLKDFDPKTVDLTGLKLLGNRQLKFLNHWAADWKGADLKAVLSQTIFCNLANYHGGNKMFLVADLDSNAWPQTGRNKAVDAIRRGFAIHYAGDQHLPSIVHHGIDVAADSMFSFCVPSIAAGYPRSWLPDREGRPVKNRMNPGLPNTGDYFDGLGTPLRVYAIGNPAGKNRPGALPTLHDKSSGYGLMRFNKKMQAITMECWRLLVDVTNPKPVDQFPGWPRTIHLTENYGRKAAAHLPTLKVRGLAKPVMQVINEANGEIEYTLRVVGNEFRPKIFVNGPHTVVVSNPDVDKSRTLKNIRPGNGELVVEF